MISETNGQDKATSDLIVIAPARKRGRKSKPILEFPEVLVTDWMDVPTFYEALSLHMARHGDSTCHLYKALISQGARLERSTPL